MSEEAPPRRRASRVGRPSFTPGRTISRTFQCLFANLASVVTLGLLALLPYALFEIFYPYPGESVGLGDGDAPMTSARLEELKSAVWFRAIVSSLLQHIAGPLVAGAVTFCVFQNLRGKKASIGECVARGLRGMVPILVASIVVGLAVGVGLMLLIVPGLIVWSMWWVATPAIVVEEIGPVAALSRSAALTKGQRLNVFLTAFLLGLIGIGVAMAVMVPLELTRSDPSAIEGVVRPDPLYMTGILAVALISMSLQGVASAVGYHDLRLHKEGIDEDELASVFD